jgi:tetratricopeptide (TPR) repeat protein
LFCSSPTLAEAVRRHFPLLAKYLLFAAAAAGAIYAFILARAEWLFEQDTARSVPAAVALVPYNSTYLSRLASWLPSQKLALLHRAVELNPFDYQSWIQLGYLAEFQQHNAASAERYYQKAAEVNKMFVPRWTLTNFYFRHARTDEFFHWATASLAITPYAPEPIFTEMWQMSQDPWRIAAAIPDRPRILLAYAWFLSNQNQAVTLPETVARLVAPAGNRDPRAWGRDDLLAAIEDRLLAAANLDAAHRIWTTLSRAQWIPFPVPTPESPVTNGDFRLPLYQHGFDWRLQPVQGVHFDPSPPLATLRIRFSGDQPESCVLLRQYLPLQPGAAYTFAWSAYTELFDFPTGLTWHLRNPSGATESDPPSPDLAAAKTWRTRIPSDMRLGVLTLEYRRALGHVRARGAVTLESVSARLH